MSCISSDNNANELEFIQWSNLESASNEEHSSAVCSSVHQEQQKEEEEEDNVTVNIHEPDFRVTNLSIFEQVPLPIESVILSGEEI